MLNFSFLFLIIEMKFNKIRQYINYMLRKFKVNLFIKYNFIFIYIFILMNFS